MSANNQKQDEAGSEYEQFGNQKRSKDAKARGPVIALDENLQSGIIKRNREVDLLLALECLRKRRHRDVCSSIDQRTDQTGHSLDVPDLVFEPRLLSHGLPQIDRKT